jgi:hypothetical protein
MSLRRRQVVYRKVFTKLPPSFEIIYEAQVLFRHTSEILDDFI